jgi:fanconi anemia group J protein
MNIKLRDEIVVIDEAHNIEDSCREATTFQITRTQLEVSKNELQPIINLHPDPKVKEAAVFFFTTVC